MEYRYWLEFLDVATCGEAYVSAYIFSPEDDKMLKEAMADGTDGAGIPVAAVAAPLAESVIDFSGSWSIDETRIDGRFVRGGSINIKQNGGVFTGHGTVKWSWFCFGGKKEWTGVFKASGGDVNTYQVRFEGSTSTVTVSEDEIIVRNPKIGTTMYYIRNTVPFKETQ